MFMPFSQTLQVCLVVTVLAQPHLHAAAACKSQLPLFVTDMMCLCCVQALEADWSGI
jgi:hypothetical protein